MLLTREQVEEFIPKFMLSSSKEDLIDEKDSARAGKVIADFLYDPNIIQKTIYI